MARRRVTRKTTAYRILSVDGGGIRGLYAAVLLDRLTREVPTLVDGAELVVDVALRTSAAPTYFPTYQGYIDGAVVANNPAMATLAQALDAGTGKQALQDVRLFSLGTGVNPAYVAGRELDWGYAQWAKPLIALMVDGMMGVADYQCARLLQQRSFRLAPILPERIGLDDVDKIPDIVKNPKKRDIRDAITSILCYIAPTRSDIP